MKARLPAAAITAALLVTALATPLAATAQTAWRCGNTYSQTPCPAGAAVAVDDGRTAEQKKQTDAASARDAKTADAMEKARLKQEANAPRALIFPAPVVAKEKPVHEARPKKKKGKKAEPETFTATDGKPKAKAKPAKKKSGGGS